MDFYKIKLHMVYFTPCLSRVYFLPGNDEMVNKKSFYMLQTLFWVGM